MKLFANKKIVFVVGIIMLALIVILAFPKKNTPVQITKTTPANDATNVIPSDSIIVEFSQEISTKQQEQISYFINPQIPSTSNWTDNKTLKITPKDFLIDNTVYKIQITFENEILYELAFRTKPYDELTEDEEVAVLARGERLYNQSIKEDLQENPWKANFPIITEKYTLIYAPPRDAYSVDFLFEFTDKERELLMAEIENKLEEIGAPEKNIIIFGE